MKKIAGLWWPDDVGEKWKHSLKHVRSLDWALAHCREQRRTRTAVQAGGNMGLWPRRMADVFSRVVTFEPDSVSRECLVRNVADRGSRVEVRAEALGAAPGRCDIHHRSLGSHQVVHAKFGHNQDEGAGGNAIAITTVDALGLVDLDLLQLDIEGYECEALRGAVVTLVRCRPLVQLELRGFTEKYGASDEMVRDFLAALHYREVSRQPGNDVVFEART